MSVSLTSLSKELILSLPVLGEDARSICESRTYETPALAHEALQGLYGRLRTSGIKCNTYPMLMIAGKMSELQAEMNRADAVNSISRAENTIERMKKAASDFAKVSTGAEEIHEVVDAKVISIKMLEARITRLEKLVIEAKALKTEEKPDAPSASEEAPEAPAAKKRKIDDASYEEDRLGNHLLLLKINKAYTHFCSLLAIGEPLTWFTMSELSPIPNANLLRINKDADPQWMSEIQSVRSELLGLASEGRPHVSQPNLSRVSPLNDRIREIGFS